MLPNDEYKHIQEIKTVPGSRDFWIWPLERKPRVFNLTTARFSLYIHIALDAHWSQS